MRKVNSDDIPEETWSSPNGTSVQSGRGISEALGRVPSSLNLDERHPFDVEIQRIPPGKKATVFHSHSAQWEFYHVISGAGTVRHEDATEPIVAGDAFLFKPGEAHQIINSGTADLLMYVIADNPIGESTHYPDSNTWVVRSPERRMLRPRSTESAEDWDDEE